MGQTGAATSPQVRQLRPRNYIGREFVSAGYAGVWAADNTREAIWDAIKRKEVYATTGPRMLVRFFGGWDFDAKDAQTRYPAGISYEKGVPMGAICSKHPPECHLRSWSPFSRTPSAETSTAFRSSKADWMPATTCRKRFTTWSGREEIAVSRVRTASCHPSATPWI
jgi:hypothetical protein